MAPTVTAPVLVYDRITQNRRKTVLLVILAVLSVVPFIWAISYGVSDFFVSHFSGSRHVRTAMREAEARRHTAFQTKLKALEAGGEADVGDIMDQERVQEEMEMREIQAAAARDRAEEVHVRNEVELVVAAALAIGLGMIFWAIASSPTSKVLAMCDARPAGTGEAEARRLLDNLSIGAGLPPPKLYVIESSQPNAFAAGVDPEHSVVVVTRALLSLLDTRELEGVLAHELSHIGNRDTRLNTFVAAIALFLRLPYLLRRRSRQAGNRDWTPRKMRMYYRAALTPIYLYIFFIAPILAAVIRAAISRSREFLADADAALLTRYPEGLIRALSKIRGAGSAVQTANPIVSHLYFADPTTAGFSSGLFGSNIFGSHPPIDQRILRLAEFNSGIAPSVIEEAIRAGQAYTKARPAAVEETNHALVAQDELSVLTAGNPVGRVFRVMDVTDPVPVYDRGDLRSPVVAQLRAGDLLTAFDDPGKLRQILTGTQVFGYIPRTVKLARVDMLPSELGPQNYREQAQTAPEAAPTPKPTPQPQAKEEYIPSYVRAADAARAAAMAQAPVLAPLPPTPVAAPMPAPMAAFVAADASAALGQAVHTSSGLGLSGKQLALAAGLFVIVFAGLSVALFSFAGK